MEIPDHVDRWMIEMHTRDPNLWIRAEFTRQQLVYTARDWQLLVIDGVEKLVPSAALALKVTTRCPTSYSILRFRFSVTIHDASGN